MSKLAEFDFALISSSLCYTGSRVLLAVVFLCLMVSTSLWAQDAAVARTYKLQQRLINNPRDVEAHLQLAMEYSLANNFVKAVETYFVLLRIDPDNFHAYNNLGILYRKSGQFRDSIHCYQQAARINPDSYWVPYNMGLCYEAMGRMQEARESYGRALSLNPSFTQALERLRVLSGSGTEAVVPALPGLADSQIYLVDSETGQPRIYSQSEPSSAPPAKPEPARPATTKKPDAEPEKISEQVVERIKREKEARRQYRTARKGPAAAIFNQAMDALDSGNIEKAIEYYVSCIITERDLLAEPDNGLIRRGLEHLKERPNRMTDGIFYRGLLIFISGNLELAVPDMQTFLEASRNSKDANQLYVGEATRIIERHAAEKAELEAREKEREAMLLAAQTASSSEVPEPEQPRASDFALKRMSIDQIIDEADRLSRESRVQDAIAVLETGLQSAPDDLRLLIKSANAYTDMLLLKGDQEAGKMALQRFETVFQKAPENSREWAIAKEMIQELKGRVR